jgi:hypothetical protein
VRKRPDLRARSSGRIGAPKPAFHANRRFSSKAAVSTSSASDYADRVRDLEPWEADVQRGGAEQNLREAAVRLMGAAPTGSTFASSRHELEELLGAVNENLERDGFHLAADVPGGEPPRYTGNWTVWVRATESGGLRLRAEFFPFLRALVAELSIDGALTEPLLEEGFGVPEDELTPQARRDLEAVQEVRARAEEEQWAEEGPPQEPRGTELEKVVAAPWQDPSGLVITTVELYADGLWVNYVLPSPESSLLERERDPDRLLFEAAFPSLEISDTVGTNYVRDDIGNMDLNGPLLHVSQWFEPAVPSRAHHLLIKNDAGIVDIEVDSG